MRARVKRTGKNTLKLAKSFVYLVIFVVFCLSILFTTSCTPLINEQERGPASILSEGTNPEKVPFSVDKNGRHTHSSLVQALSFAINEYYPLDDIYVSLGSQTLQGLSLDEFRTFIESLRPGDGIKINNFSQLSREESNEYLSKILRLKGKLADVAINSVFYRLEYEPINNPDDQDTYVILALQEDANSGYYLDAEWVREINNIYIYAMFYFDALENSALNNSDYGALAYLIQHGPNPLVSDLDSWPEVAAHKAKATSDYYKQRVTTAPLASRPTVVLPGFADFIQEYRYMGRLSGVREVSFYDLDGHYTVVESIPDSLNSRESQLLIYDEPVFINSPNKVNIQESTEVHPLLGPILAIEKLDSYNDKAVTDYYLIEYYGMSFVIKGFADKNSDFWQGNIREVSLDSSIFSLGKILSVRMPEADFHKALPFYLDNKEIIQMEDTFNQAELSYEAESGKISKLVLKNME